MNGTESSPLPNSSKMEHNQKVGIDNAGYIVKKGTASGEGAKFNKMPPGMDINDQTGSDIRPMEIKFWSGGDSFPGDGWS